MSPTVIAGRVRCVQVNEPSDTRSEVMAFAEREATGGEVIGTNGAESEDTSAGQMD